MLLSEIKLKVKRQFGDESGSLIDDTDILGWANDALIDIVRHADILTAVYSTAATGLGSVSLPATYLRVKGATLNNVPLSLVPMADGFDINAAGTQDCKSGVCYVDNNKLWFNSAQATGNIVLYYNRRPTPLVNDSDTPEIPVHMHEDIVRYCIARAKELNEDLEGAMAIMSDYSGRLNYAKDEATNADASSYPGIRVLPGDEGNY